MDPSGSKHWNLRRPPSGVESVTKQGFPSQIAQQSNLKLAIKEISPYKADNRLGWIP